MAQILSEKPKVDLPITLSVSKVKTFKDCPAKFYFCYVEKLPRKDWDFHIFGKFLHEVLENFHRKIIDGSELLHHVLMTECFKTASANWHDKLSLEQKKESSVILAGYLKQMSEQKKLGTLPTILTVEKNFYINIDDTVLLNGFIDRTQLDPDGVLHVSDYKTTKNLRYLKDDLFQLLTYAYVMCLEDPTIKKVRTSYILLRHNFKAIVKDFSRDEIMKIESIFLEYAKNIKEEKIFKANPTPLCNFCDYIQNCDAGLSFKNKRGSNNEFGKSPSPEFGKSDW
jgi:DNA helicase-2/ATP-dependent DNA helicase PcrA